MVQSFTFVTLPLMGMFILFSLYTSAPFKEKVFTNRPFSIFFLFIVIYNTVVTFSPGADFFGFDLDSKFMDNGSFVFTLWILTIAICAISYIFDVLVIKRLLKKRD